jgi:hypothetical protein
MEFHLIAHYINCLEYIFQDYINLVLLRELWVCLLISGELEILKYKLRLRMICISEEHMSERNNFVSIFYGATEFIFLSYLLRLRNQFTKQNFGCFLLSI